ncbi:hypothetical protein DBR32_03000 [Taibaiella sp. KBW10]|uniref:T9SS-dependent choice-of-anchor J family protein n=1 Tax=Taibaiella sp. KBW10 TaxID=2153357 RepID=UPI000F5A1A37|nr:T9SS type A sorting domain-containing protein [Taibaiella sp. KBW10]RQO32579.1 hypothetical protein DBR32_03000 [Taibaiella sp. KBW10]
MNRTLLRLLCCFLAVLSVSLSHAQVIDITSNAGTSAAIALANSNNAANESIYTETEIGAGNFITAGTAITHIGLNASTVGTNTVFNNVSIYLKEVPTTTTTFTAGVYSTSDYTLVFSGSVTIATTGFTEIPLSTAYTRTSGKNLQILITRTDNATHGGFIWNCSMGNNTSPSVSSNRRYNASAALSGTTSMTTSFFRPAIRFKHIYANDVGVNLIYSFTKLPIPSAAQQSVSAFITNYGTNAVTNLPVSLNISGANSATRSQTVASLAPGASATVTFPVTSNTYTGTNTITVSVPADDYLSNNAKTTSQLVNMDTWSYTDGGPATGGIGFNATTGDLVAKFNADLATYLKQVSLNFSAGGQPFKIGIWDAGGTGGSPGTLLWESAQYTSTTGVYLIPVAPALAIPAGNFYVGMRQTGTISISCSYQAEIPMRTATFYYKSPASSTSWIDYAPTSALRFMIELKLIFATDASLSQMTFGGGGPLSCPGGTQSISTTLSNTGINAIAAGAASIHLKIAGANTYSATAQNISSIAPGSSEVITFNNISLNNAGANYDTAYVVLSGDQQTLNDTVTMSHQIQTVLSAFPQIASYEDALTTFSNIQQLNGSGNWNLHTGNVTNAGLSGPLAPHSGNRFMRFNAISFPALTTSRLSGNCISLPALANANCNQLELGFWMSHDNSYATAADSLYVSISTNSGSSWTRIGGYQRYNALYTLPGWAKKTIDLSPYAGQTVLIGFEAVGKAGNIIGLDDIMVGSQAIQSVGLSGSASNNVNLQLSCEDAGWSYYTNPLLPNENILAINWDPNGINANTAAKAAAIPTITLDANTYTAQNTATAQATFTMKRYWNVAIGSNTLTAPVNVRFFYDSLEIAAVDNAVANLSLTYGAPPANPTWFKTISGAFVPSPTQISANAVLGAIPLINTNTTNNRINGIPYAQFNGITSFSGGTYAGGVGAATPLPLSGIAISATAMGSKNGVHWTITDATATDYFWLEKSIDGKAFSPLQKIACKDKTQLSYTAYDENPVKGSNYYRIKEMTLSGHSDYSNIVRLNNENSTTVSVFPNPAKESVHVQLSNVLDGLVQLTLTDYTGKVMYHTEAHNSKGLQTVTLPVKGFAAGIYLLKVSMGTETHYHKVTLY